MPGVNDEEVMTKVEEISKSIREELNEGFYALGDRMPGVSDIEERFGVSTPTAVAAMKQLALEGLVQPRQGVGYFAIPPVNDKKDNLGLNVFTARQALIAAREAVDVALARVDAITRI